MSVKSTKPFNTGSGIFLPDLQRFLQHSQISFADSGSVDAFTRLRVSETANLFDSQLTYDLAPLQFEQITSGTGATVTHDATNRCAIMTFTDTPNEGKAYMQSYEYIPYQPGRSQLAFITFNFHEGVAGATKFAGLSDGVDGIEFRNENGTNQVRIWSSTDSGVQTIPQSQWNIDKLDGNGISKATLDITKDQILVIDLQALYVGRVRVGFDINGIPYYVHEFNHANIFDHPYLSRATLPIRCGMQATATVSTTMNFICSSVASEGGAPSPSGRSFIARSTVSVASEARTHAMSIRPKLLFNGFTNRSLFQLESVDVIALGNNSLEYDISLGQALSGTTTFADVNTAYSAFEVNTAGTLDGTPALSFAGGYAPATGNSKGAIKADLTQRYPITLNQAGQHRDMGTINIAMAGIGGSTTARLTTTWREVR